VIPENLMPESTVRRWVRYGLIVCLGFLALGCSTSSRAKTFVAHGKVRFKKDQIPVGALVVFHPKDPKVEKQIGGKPFGKVGEDGTFTLTTYAENDGAPEGEYGVTIDWRKKPSSDKLSISNELGPGIPSAVNEKFSDPRKPFQFVTVKPAGDNNFEFDVE
jgi:hypothetical protein